MVVGAVSYPPRELVSSALGGGEVAVSVVLVKPTLSAISVPVTAVAVVPVSVLVALWLAASMAIQHDDELRAYYQARRAAVSFAG